MSTHTFKCSLMDCASSNGRLYLLYSCAVNKHHVTCALGMRLLSAVSIVFQLKHLSVTDVQKPLHITSFCSMHTYVYSTAQAPGVICAQHIYTLLRRRLVSFAICIFTLYCAGAWCRRWASSSTAPPPSSLTRSWPSLSQWTSALSSPLSTSARKCPTSRSVW